MDGSLIASGGWLIAVVSLLARATTATSSSFSLLLLVSSRGWMQYLIISQIADVFPSAAETLSCVWGEGGGGGGGGDVVSVLCRTV